MKQKIIILIGLLMIALLGITGCVQNSETSENTSKITEPSDLKKVDQCQEIPKVGKCRAAIPKYFFNQETSSCEEFIWGGCEGNVPFETLNECQTQCETGKINDEKDNSSMLNVNTCTEEQKKTQKCTLEYAPVCGDNGKTYGNKCGACASKEIDTWTSGECGIEDTGYQSLCEKQGGQWNEEANDCEEISKDTCENLGGQFNECDSACRSEDGPVTCTMQCVQTCSFPISVGFRNEPTKTEEELSCEEQNGKLMNNGQGFEMCYLPTADAGKTCTDNEQCESLCVIENRTQTTGVCYHEKPFSGCFLTLINGKAVDICS